MLFILTQQAKLSLILSNAEIKLKKIADKKRVEQMFIENYLITRCQALWQNILFDTVTSVTEVHYFKGVLKNLEKYIGQHSLSFIEKETPAQVFPCEFSEIFQNTYYVEYQRMAAFESLVIRKNYEKL